MTTRRSAWLFAATLLGALSAVNAQKRALKDTRRVNLHSDSFEDRMQMYAQWSKFATSHGRGLAQALSPVGTPPTPAPGPANVPAPAPGPSGFGNCKVLRWHDTYANITLVNNRTIPDTPNFGTCCQLCNDDPSCVAWTRVAGGDPANFRNCYLKYDYRLIDPSPDRTKGNHEGHAGDSGPYPELRYVTGGSPILESGTKPDVYPADYYGCPYSPGNPTTPCDAPAGCNVNGAGVFTGPCIGN